MGIFERIDHVRLLTLKERRGLREEFAREVILLNDLLHREYVRDELWRVSAWHKLIGSSQQSGLESGVYFEEITQRINDFVAKWENLLLVNKE